MHKLVNHQSMSLCGYTTPWCARAGQVVDLHLSTVATPDAITLIRLDTNERTNSGIAVEHLADLPAQRSIDQGSYVQINATERQKTGAIRSLSFEFYLTTNDGLRTLFEADGFVADIDEDMIILRRDGAEIARLHDIPIQTWLKLTLTIEAANLALHVVSYDMLAPFEQSADAAIPTLTHATTALYLGTDADMAMPCLNARFSTIALHADNGHFRWTFPAKLQDGPIVATDGDITIAMETMGLPTFCVTSPRWDGSTFDPRVAPSHYDAIHCHDDDMDALEWPASYRVVLPDDLPSGIYAFSIDCAGETEDIAFFVSAFKPENTLVFVVPTATYLAYADEYLPPHLYEWKCDDRGHRLAQDNQFKSLYDYHNDLSGVSICSYRKPKATLRPDYRYPLGDCPHNLPVDLEFLRFCKRHDIGVDIITDHDLHIHGLGLLQPYKAVLTGSHPEYLSVEMEQAYRRFAADGGSIVYLGGNGFATSVAFKDDLMELRRSPLEAGRTWDGPIGEQAFAITNEPGGYLRSRGRGEFSLTGVAISLMGFDNGRPFTRTAASFDERNGWLFAGVQSVTFGETGRVLSAAAGYEVDATDPRLGTATDTIVVARADGFPDSFYHDPSRWYQGGETEMQTRRCAEMTVRYLKSGGLIFSASSVAWLGALPDAGDMNDVGRITLNVLRQVQHDA